ncbi:MAG: glycosyltransferase, partial [Candidatus Heimdallarchaeota archaeon]|nr:glycosyltransferase [Candidatus Heimdallarchaeota archaeon]MCK4877683.1 glycosyltransferase [Candidatus Heimdallarchaeota archaeon]
PEEGIDVVVLTSGTKQQTKQNFQNKTGHSNIYYSKETKLRKLGYKTKILPVLELLRLDHLVFFPDIYFRWIKSAVKVGQEVIKKEKPDAIYVTGPPFSSFIAAYKLSINHKIPLIVEYRDPWSGNPYAVHPFKTIDKKIRKWERKIIDHSQLLVTVGHEYAEFIASKLEIDKDLFEIIHNGFFPETPYKQILDKKEDVFTISFFGSFYTLQKPIFEKFIEGFKLMIDEKKLKPTEIKLQYAGGVSRSVINRIISKGKIASYFEDLGFLTKESLNEEIQKSHLVFLTIPQGTEYMLQTKIYDYLGGNSHILLVGETSAMSKLCVECEQKFIEIKLEGSEVITTLSNLYEKWKENRLEYGCNSEKLENYNRKILAQKLAKIIKNTK